MKEVRDIKIDLLMGNQNPVIDLFCEITSGIEIINCNVYNEDGLEFIYHKDGQWIFYQDCKNEKFWTHYYKYWEFFESKFHLKYEEIQAITKLLVEEALKREVGTPRISNSIRSIRGTWVEDALKREVGTPTSNGILNESHVEEVLKREVSTPSGYTKIVGKMVEDALKREVSTPSGVMRISSLQVEEALKREVNTDKNL